MVNSVDILSVKFKMVSYNFPCDDWIGGKKPKQEFHEN